MDKKFTARDITPTFKKMKKVLNCFGISTHGLKPRVIGYETDEIYLSLQKKNALGIKSVSYFDNGKWLVCTDSHESFAGDTLSDAIALAMSTHYGILATLKQAEFSE